MAKSKVFFTDRKTEPYYNMLDKLEHVLKEQSSSQGIEKDEKVMIKTHFGQGGTRTTFDSLCPSLAF